MKLLSNERYEWLVLGTCKSLQATTESEETNHQGSQNMQSRELEVEQY
jgi:hypothetical protein